MQKTKTTDQIFHTDLGVRVRMSEEDAKKVSGTVRVVRDADGKEYNMDRTQIREAKKTWETT